MPIQSPTASRTRGLWARCLRFLAPWLILVVALLAMVPGITHIPPVDRDEARFAQASKQMLETGDRIDIRLGDEPRHKKPIGIYWLQAATAATVGDGARGNIWAYRLPSLAGAIAAVLVTAALAASMAGRTASVIAGLALATTLVLGVEARLAKTDAVLLALVVVAQAALWQVWSRRLEPAAGRWWLVFWTAQGAAILIKGPIGPLVSALTVATLVVWERRVDWLARLRPGRGLGLAALIATPWLIAVTVATDGAFFAEAAHDLFGKVGAAHEGHGAPPGTYLVAVWATAWPWAALLPLAAIWAWRTREDDATRFLIAWVVGFWLVFELLATKLPHYVLPTFPALAIASAIALLNLNRRRPFVVGLPLAMATAIGTVLAMASLALPYLLRDTPSAAAQGGALLTLALLWAVWRAYLTSRFRRAAGYMTAAALVLYMTIYGGVFPRMEALDISRRMADAAALHRPCPTTAAASVGYSEPSALFTLGSDLEFASFDRAAALLDADPCALVFATSERAAAVVDATTVPVQRLATIAGWRLNGGRWIEVQLYGRAP